MKKLVLILAVIIVIIVHPQKASAETVQRSTPDFLSEEQARIMNEVTDPNGILDRYTHKRFWDLMPPRITREMRRNPDVLLGEFPMAYRFQLAAWKSVRLSAKHRRIIYHSSYMPAKTNAQNSRFAPYLAQGFANAEALIKAAASGETLEIPGKGTHLIDTNLADVVLGSLEKTLKRLLNLFDPDWRG